MKRIINLSKTRKLNKIYSLPIIHNYSHKRNLNNSLNNISATTNASIIKNSINNSTLISNKSLIMLKKIKLNNKYNSQRSINNSEIYPSNIKKKTIQILYNADKIMKERRKYDGLGQKQLTSIYLKTSKEVCYKNYIINLLKERRIHINEKELIISQALKDFSEQYEKDHTNFINFVEEIKNIQRKDEDIIIELKQIREKKEKIYEQEKLLNKKLYEKLERKIRELYILKGYATFFHKIIEKKFIYDGTPEIKPREKKHGLIADLIINIYENEDKYNQLPKELENIDLFMQKYIQLEDKILSNISYKESIDKEKENIQKNYEYEIEQLNISKIDYENDLKYLKNEIKNINMEMKNYKIHEDEYLDNYINYIIELGKEIETNIEIPKNINKKYLTDIVAFCKNTLKNLGNIEEKINTNILKIENILKYGKKEDIDLIKSLIMEQKNKNIREQYLKNKKEQEKMKILKNLQIIEKAKKMVLTGRKIIVDYPNNNKKDNIKNIIKKENNNNDIDYKYSIEDGNNGDN